MVPCTIYIFNSEPEEHPQEEVDWLQHDLLEDDAEVPNGDVPVADNVEATENTDDAGSFCSIQAGDPTFFISAVHRDAVEAAKVLPCEPAIFEQGIHSVMVKYNNPMLCDSQGQLALQRELFGIWGQRVIPPQRKKAVSQPVSKPVPLEWHAYSLSLSYIPRHGPP